MRPLPPAVAEARARRAGLITHFLIWAQVRQMNDPSVTDTVGFWTGDDDATFVINGQSREYFGAGECQGFDALAHVIGLNYQEYSVTLSGLSPEGRTVVLGYDLQLCPCEIHSVDFSPETMLALSEPQPEVMGWITDCDVTKPAQGDEASVRVTLVTNAYSLTKGLALTKSDSSLRARSSGDAFYQYSSAKGGAPWGGNRSADADTPAQVQILRPNGLG